MYLALIGEERYGLWRYGAEPNDDTTLRYLIASIDEGMYADVECIALVEGASADEGFILVSQQGVSALNVYRRAAPHALVQTFTIYENIDKGIDEVANTDGIAAVGTTLGSAFRKGLVVVRKLAPHNTCDYSSKAELFEEAYQIIPGIFLA